MRSVTGNYVRFIVGVHIHCCDNGHLWFRPYGDSLFQTPKRKQKAVPHHSVPRLGSACQNEGIAPWVAALGHPWPSAAKPASCRFTHCAMPAFGQRGLTGRPRSKTKSEAALKPPPTLRETPTRSSPPP